MEAKEKAKELVDKFTMDNTRQGERNAIKCALIAVDEIISINNLADEKLNYKDYFNDNNGFKSYWNEVKNEINKI